jgi:glycosyltransferase involved in cell wall biosynthesis
MIETGTSALYQTRKRVHGNKLSFLWVGQLISRKALDILLYAIANSDKLKSSSEVYILGEGSRFEYYLELSKKLGIEDLIFFKGNVPHDKMFEYMNKADLLIHTSIMEGTPHVLLEALSSGLPVICHDAYGMGIAVTEESGIKIPLKSPKTSIQGFQEAMEYFIDHPDEIKNKSEGALKRAKELTWDIMVKKIAEDYIRIIKDEHTPFDRGKDVHRK